MQSHQLSKFLPISTPSFFIWRFSHHSFFFKYIFNKYFPVFFDIFSNSTRCSYFVESLGNENDILTVAGSLNLISFHLQQSENKYKFHACFYHLLPTNLMPPPLISRHVPSAYLSACKNLLKVFSLKQCSKFLIG